MTSPLVAKPVVKFAVVREDPAVEIELIQHIGARAVALVASGGCTALELKHRFDSMEVTAFDTNPAQIDHVRQKMSAVAAGDGPSLNVDTPDPRGLNQRGMFEKLFRILRFSLLEFISPLDQIESYFDPRLSDDARSQLVQSWLENPYWGACFGNVFHDAILHAMFGPDATQHAHPGSYPSYFSGVLARGLLDPLGHRNPFIQHILLGRYLVADAPSYVHARRWLDIELIRGGLERVDRLDRFDLVQLSNILDWSSDSYALQCAQHLANHMRRGAYLLIRQLNNTRPLRAIFSPAFRFDDRLSHELLARDRSLFYNRIEVARRI
jgi:S-adenosylmethionine-diacylglycerol 3-amino-3-carboxypropyl transferase